MTIRAAWMTLQGVPDDEIAELCDPQQYPADLAVELQHLRAALDLRRTRLSNSDLAELARKHQPPATW